MIGRGRAEEVAVVQDYYRTLGIETTADLETIKRAFRKKAMVCHPDRGGTHERMVLVLEAWEVLSDPQRRQRYDAARAHQENPVAQDAAAMDARQARQRAEQYQRRWADMEVWLNELTKDFTGAKYSSVPFGTQGFLSGIRLPTVGQSVTGWVFIVLGAALGGALLSPVVYAFLHPHRMNLMVLIIVAAPAVGGAWLGAALHNLIGEAIKNAQAERARQPQCEQERETERTQEAQQHAGAADARIICCEKCNQKLRVPALLSELLVTCRSCGHKFSAPPK